MTGRYVHLEIPSIVALLKVVDSVCEEFGRLAGLDEDGVHCLSASVREATANAIRHGNGNDQEKPVRIRFEVATAPSPARVVVRILDQGRGFQPDAVADPVAPDNLSMTGGRGLFLMRAFMDDVEVRCLPDGGTEVVLFKHIGQNAGQVT
jgi:serine/threonine-protein kinase RsbW